jgi:hypothetical protein
MAERDLGPVFDRLRAVLAAHVDGMDVVHDEPGNYHLNTRHVRKDGYVLMFGAVRTGARSVSYHLMPLYMSGDLVDGMSDGLRRRMQGKSCLNFSTVDEVLVAELESVTARAARIARSPRFVTG